MRAKQAMFAICVGLAVFPATAQTIDDHLSVQDPAAVPLREGNEIYLSMRSMLADLYALSSDPTARNYQDWRRANDYPFRSATHGNRFINHYANGIAQAYGQPSAVMPVGAIIAKDAITITASGDIFPGPLAIMEKMPAGFDPNAGNWRYTEILPDGSYIAPPEAANASSARFCVACHNTAPDGHDRLFLVPAERSVQ